jgi:hypothetical protein
VGDSLAAAKAIFGEPREVRGKTVLFGPREDWAEVVVLVESGFVQGFTAHWKKPAEGIFGEEVFEPTGFSKVGSLPMPLISMR